MIRKTLGATQAATYSIDLPNPGAHGLPTPAGTGFFVSPDGWFITAAHVVEDGNGNLRPGLDQAWLTKEDRPGQFGWTMCQSLTVEHRDAALDFALLRVDWSKNLKKDHLKNLAGFPHLTVSARQLEEGEPVYAFGYPLPEFSMQADSGITFGHVSHSPRTTSAIVAATMDRGEMVWTPADPQLYVLDKALNYGNSGGPILAVETGRVHAFCSRFQPVEIPQPYTDSAGKQLRVKIPSLYGVVVSLSHPAILDELGSRGIPISRSD